MSVVKTLDRHYVCIYNYTCKQNTATGNRPMPSTTTPAAAEGMPKISARDVMTKAWADYRRDAFKGWGVRRGGPFDRKHFAYCLRMAWAVAKELAAKATQPAPAPQPVKVLAPAVAARAEAIRSELMDMQMGNFIPWNRHAALSAELAQLSA
jgi:hypothetical protein